MNAISLSFRQIRYETIAFWRNPAAAFFTFLFPLIFLVIFNLVFGDREMEIAGGVTSVSTFYVPAILALSVIGACYTNVAMGISFARDGGVLKRVRGTPLPAWAYLFGRIGNAVIVSILLVIIVTFSGVVFFGVDAPTNTMPAFLLTLMVGAAAFCALGMAVTALIPNAEASPAIVNASILPLLFVSDVFIPLDDAPYWLQVFANVFPVRHFSTALQTAFNPFETGAGFEWMNLLVMAGWLAAGLLLAVRFFRWEPRR